MHGTGRGPWSEHAAEPAERQAQVGGRGCLLRFRRQGVPLGQEQPAPCQQHLRLPGGGSLRNAQPHVYSERHSLRVVLYLKHVEERVEERVEECDEEREDPPAAPRGRVPRLPDGLSNPRYGRLSSGRRRRAVALPISLPLQQAALATTPRSLGP